MDSLQLQQQTAAYAAAPLLRLLVQGLYAYACKQQGHHTNSDEVKATFSSSSKAVLLELRESAVPNQLEYFRNCKRVLIGMQVGSLQVHFQDKHRNLRMNHLRGKQLSGPPRHCGPEAYRQICGHALTLYVGCEWSCKSSNPFCPSTVLQAVPSIGSRSLSCSSHEAPGPCLCRFAIFSQMTCCFRRGPSEPITS